MFRGSWLGFGLVSVIVLPGKVFCACPHSAASERASWCTAAFDALYAAVLIPWLDMWPEIEAKRTMLPGRLVAWSSFATARAMRKVPDTLTSRILRNVVMG